MMPLYAFHTLSGTQTWRRRVEEGGREGERRGKERRRGRENKGTRSREKVDKGEKTESSLTQRTVMTRSFYPSPHPTRATIECITTSLRDKIPQPSSATLDGYPGPHSHLHNRILWLKRANYYSPLHQSNRTKPRSSKTNDSKALMEYHTWDEVQLNIFIH